MNITYLIGNGFDIGLGLKTDYKSFLDWYLHQPNDSSEVGWLKDQILKDTELWSDAELAFGVLKFSEFGGKSFDTYELCLESFVSALSRYLIVENGRLQIPAEKHAEVASWFLRGILQLWKYMTPECEASYRNAIQKSPPLTLTFVTFNYTDSLERLLGFDANSTKEFSVEIEKDKTIPVIVKGVLHAHGSLESDFIFGVDDDQQIADPNVRAYCVRNGGVIKARLEQKTGLRNRKRAIEAINNSNLIVTYGLSFGKTDRSWWDALYSCFNDRNVPLVFCPFVKDFPDSGYSCSYRARMYEREKCRVFASLFDRAAGLREVIESVDAPRITVLHPKKVPDGMGRVNPCDFFKLKYFYQKFVEKVVV